MGKNLFRFSSKRILFSTMMASALVVGAPQLVFADIDGTQSVLQSASVRGKVTDANGEPIIGANVQEKGTVNGVITDIDGNFTLNLTSKTSKIIISFIGYKTIELSVTDPKLQAVVLVEDSETLDEVVVIGYGTQKKATLTGAVTVVGAKMLEGKGNLSNPLQALQGTVPGVIITRSSGAPGEEGWGMKLRGATSTNSTDPLVIIDGVEFSDGISGMRNLNTDDIESINFLKDASAAIYGSKAAGGVVLITTKKAKEGRTTVQYNGSFTAKVIGLQPELMSIDQWADALIAAQTNDGYNIATSSKIRYADLAKRYKNHYIDLTSNPNVTDGFSGVSDFVFMENDWQDLLWGNSSATQHELAVSGGTSKALYRLSLGYMYDGSTLQWGNNSKERYNLRLTNTFQLAKNVSLESIIAYSREFQVKPSLIGNVLSASIPQPGLPSSTVDGRPYSWNDWRSPNWLAELGGDNKLKVSSINISEQFKWNITKELDAVVQLGYNTGLAIRDIQEKAIDWYNYAGTKIVWSEPTQENSKYTKSYANTDYYMVSGYLNWHKTLANKHNLSAMAGAQYNYTQYERTETAIKNIKPSLEVPNGSGEKTVKPEKWHEAMMSYFGRLGYDYKGRYLLDANLRYDGSSKFQPENRWQFFWGMMGAWRLTEEKFMQPLTSFIDNLKLRFSYGMLGNQSGIGRYDGTQLYDFTSSGGVLMDGKKVSIINTNKKIVSTERTWERIHNYNIALEFGFLGNRLTGVVDLFLKKNNNMLIEAQYPGILGDGAPSANIGKFEAKGWEGTLNWADKIGTVSYHIGASATYTTNKLIDLGATSVMKSGFQKTQQGYPLNSFFGLRYTGKIQNEEQLQKYYDYYLNGNGIGMQRNLRLGDNMFEDVNGDGKLDENDMVYLGTDDPKLSYSINAGFEWKGIDFSVIFQGVGRRTVFRERSSWSVPMKSWWLNTTTQSVGKTWSAEQPDAYYPTYSNTSSINDYNYQCSSWSVEDGAYIRLKNLTIGYTLPSVWLAKIKFLSKLRVYLTGADMWEHSNIKDGWDPEQSRDVKELGRYPFNRTYTVGINATF